MSSGQWLVEREEGKEKGIENRRSKKKLPTGWIFDYSK